MSPYQHGEVYVTDDGAETDLELGHYERFTGVVSRKSDNITSGKVYQKIISKERKGEYLGATVQVIPHITDEIKRRIKGISNEVDVQITEIGGTVGDIEILPFLEAARQIRKEFGQENVMFVHVTLVPFIGPSTELKTKPCSIFMGPSGVGKTTVLNMIIPGLQNSTATVSRKIKRGKNTTRNLELFS